MRQSPNYGISSAEQLAFPVKKVSHWEARQVVIYRLIILDDKATSKNGDVVLDQQHHDTYRRQLDIYASLLKMNGYAVHEKAFWVYCNGIKGAEAFGNCLNFKTVLIEHPADTS